MTRDEARARVDEIDNEFERAPGWGSWMVMLANEREDLANLFSLEQRWQARCGGRRTN